MDPLEKEYFEFKRLFNSRTYKRFKTPKELKELGDLLKYRRMKKELDGLDVDALARMLIEQLKDLLAELNKL